MTRLIANNFSTTLNGAITAIATSMTLTSVTGFPAVGSGDTCQVTLDDGAGNIEIVTATAIAGSVITITRAQEGTSGFAFADLDPVEIRLTVESLTDVLGADLTPALAGPLDASLAGAYIGFGGSSTSTAYNITHSGGSPQLTGAVNYKYSFTSSSLVMNAGTSFYSLVMHNSNGFSCTTNNVVRIQANNSGVQFGATGARINSVLDEDTMSSDSATDLATQQSIKAYADAIRVGTTTNDNATAGDIGEYKSAELTYAGRTSISAGTLTDVVSISLTAGDWIVIGNVGLVGTATTEFYALYQWCSLTSVTFNDPHEYGAFNSGSTVPFKPAGNVFWSNNTPALRISLASTTTVYLSGFTQFTTSTAEKFGKIMAWRIR